jgi:hypothetical protein
MKAACDEERMERGTFLVDPQNCQSVWTVCNGSEGFCGAIRYYNNDSSNQCQAIRYISAGITKGKTKFRLVRFKLRFGD